MSSGRTVPWLPARLRPARLSIVCFPCAGQGTSFFRGWKEDVPPDVQLVPVALPGREKRTIEAPVTSAVELARALLDDVGDLRAALGGPFALFGHSMGAVISTALAAELVERAWALPEALFVAAKVPPHLARTRPVLHNLPDRELLEEVQKLDGLAKEVDYDDDLRAWAAALLRADLTLTEGYRAPDDLRFPFPLRAFGGTEDSAVSAGDLAEWSRYSARPLPPVRFPGGHFFVRDGRVRSAFLGRLLSDTGIAHE